MSRPPAEPRSRAGAWVRVADVGPARKDAPAVARRLALQRAWRDVAGAELAARLPVLERRGPCLVLAVPHATWLASLPAIEARVAKALAEHPDLPGISRLEGRIATVVPARPAAPAVSPMAAAEVSDTSAGVQARWAALAARLLRESEEDAS